MMSDLVYTVSQAYLSMYAKNTALYFQSRILELFYGFFFFYFILWPFQEYFTYIKPIVHQRWAKTEEPGEKKHLTIRKQNLAFPHVTQTRLEPQQ